MSLIDRRRSPRAPLETSATLSRSPQDPLGAFDVVNLAAGGLLLAGRAPAPIDTVLEVTLALANGQAVVLPGHILRERTTRDGHAFVVVFGELSSAQQHLVRDTIDLALAAARSAHVLVVDDSAKAGQALRGDLSQLGHAAFAVTNPLEALRLLEQPNRVELAIVDRVLGASDGLDLVAYLAEQHPYLRRVLMSDPQGHAQLASALRQRPQAAPHHLLTKPWTGPALARMVAGF
jgi:CheY-like chemotaxis protein